MNDPLDRQIRDAVADVARRAPAPLPYDQLGTVPTPTATHRRWPLAAAAGVIVVAGVAAVAITLARRSDDSPVQTLPTAPTVTTPAPATTPDTTATSQPTTAPSATTVPATTAAPATTPPTTEPGGEIPGLFPRAGDSDGSTFTAVAPSGSIDAAPGDMVSLAVDGDLWLHPGAFDPTQYGRSPGDPVRLVDGEDPRAQYEEMGPNVVSWVGGFVNGALIYGDCCEPAAGNVLALSEPDGPRANISYGWAADSDATGRRWATANDYAVQVLDFTTGRGYSRGLNESGEYFNVSDVAWSPDATEVWLLGWTNAEGYLLVRYSSDATLTELDRRVLGSSDGDFPTDWFSFAGRLSDGTTVLTRSSGSSEAGATELTFLAPDGSDDDRQSPWQLPAQVNSVSVSPDGTTLAYVADDTAYLVREGQQPVEWGTDMMSVWFVTTPPSPIGTSDCPPPDNEYGYAAWTFTDLDGDGVSERVWVDAAGPAISVCGTALDVPDFGFDERLDSVNLSAVDVESDGISELWLTGADTDGAGQCHTLLRLDAGGLSPIAERQCEVGFACIAIDGAVQPVFYERDGLTLTAHLADGTELGTHTYTSDDEIPFSLFDLTC